MKKYFKFECVLGTQLDFTDSETGEMWQETGFGWNEGMFNLSGYEEISKDEFDEIKNDNAVASVSKE